MKHFKISEFACNCGCKRADMYQPFLIAIDGLRGELGFPFVISSGFRCVKHNEAVGGAGGSLHMRGMAADVLCDARQAYQILSASPRWGFTGIGISQKGDGKRFVHLDNRSGPAVMWSY